MAQLIQEKKKKISLETTGTTHFKAEKHLKPKVLSNSQTQNLTHTGPAEEVLSIKTF